MMKSAFFAAAALSASMAGPALASGDGASFLHKAMEGDNSEMALGRLAMRQGASSGTHAFGHMLFTDHSRGKAQVAAVARRLRVPLTDELAPEAVAERAKLQGLHGRAFDQEFARYMVEDHRKDIADFTSETTSGDPPAVVALARQTLPVLHHHLETAERLTR